MIRLRPLLSVSLILIALIAITTPTATTLAQAKKEMTAKEARQSIETIKNNIKLMQQAYNHGNRVEVGKLSSATRDQWYGLPWSIRSALDEQYPGTRKKMKTILDGTAKYAGGHRMSGEVIVLFHEGITTRNGNVKTRNDKLYDENGELVRERDARTEKRGNTVNHERTWSDGQGNTLRKVESTATTTGNVTKKNTRITDGSGEQTKAIDTKTTREGNVTKKRTEVNGRDAAKERKKEKRLKRKAQQSDSNGEKQKRVKFGGERWAEIEAVTTRNGHITRTIAKYENSNGNKLTFVRIATRNGQFYNVEGAWFDESGKKVAQVKAKRVSVNGKTTGEKAVANGLGEVVWTREYEHVKEGNTVYHYDERTGKNGKTRIYEGKSTKRGDGTVEHEGTVTHNR